MGGASCRFLLFRNLLEYNQLPARGHQPGLRGPAGGRDHPRRHPALELSRQRLPLGTIGKGLKQAFGAECFYCRTRLETGGHVDHVLPWSITPIDGVANLVVSCQPCNTSKSDNLPAIHHVTRALKRPKAALQQIADADEADTEYERVRRAASNLYHRASANHTEVWQGIGDFIPLDLSSPPDWLLGG